MHNTRTDSNLFTRIQRATSAIPGAESIKRRLHNDPNACGAAYWFATRGQSLGFTLVTYHQILMRRDPYYSY